MKFFIGGLLIVDGIWSLLTPKNTHLWLLDIGRVVRVFLGIGVLFL